MSTKHQHWETHWGWVLGVFLAALIALVANQQISDSTWTPHGADWDTWYQSILSITHSGVVYPPNRWPIYGIVGSLFGILPGPLHVNAQVASLTAAAGAIAGLFLISRTLIGFFGALTVAILTLTTPIVLILSSWISSYPLWATAAIWAVAGMVEALRTDKRFWWIVAGTGASFVFAIQAKGLGIGLILVGLIALFSLLDWRNVLGNMGRIMLPIALMSVLYMAFPSPLLTLQAQIEIAEQGANPSPPGQGPSPPANRDDLFSGGYIFGRSMTPAMIYQTVTDADSATQDREKRLADSLKRLSHIFPSVQPNLLKWLAAGAAMGILSGLIATVRNRGQSWARAAAPLAGWLGTIGIIGGVLPSLLSQLSTRFLTPGFFVAALFLVAPIALLSNWSTRIRWIPLLLLPIALSPQTPWKNSPWRHSQDTQDRMKAVLIPGDHAVRLWYVLNKEYPDATIHVSAPAAQGLLVLDGRDGQFLTPDPRFHGHTELALDPSDYVLLWEEPENIMQPHPNGEAPPPLLNDNLTDNRTIKGSWPQTQGAMVVLYGP